MTDMGNLLVNGWRIYLHPAFEQQFLELKSEVERLRQKKPDEWKQGNATKRLTAITRLITDIIPQNPKRPEYQQGNTLGKAHSHWRRAKFFQQYRLFFRFNEKHRIIIFAWVNNEKTKRAYGSKSDAYRVFANRLSKGNPSDDWEELLNESFPLSQ